MESDKWAREGEAREERECIEKKLSKEWLVKKKKMVALKIYD